MHAAPQRVLMLVLENGKAPVEEWLLTIRDTVTRARIVRQIDKLERGLFGDRKGAGDKVSELRLDFGPGYRVYYGRVENTIVVLLGGGDKSTQNADIKKVQDLWDDFLKKGAPEEALMPWTGEQEGESD